MSADARREAAAFAAKKRLTPLQRRYVSAVQDGEDRIYADWKADVVRFRRIRRNRVPLLRVLPLPRKES